MVAAEKVAPTRPTLQPSNSIRISLQRRQASLSSYQTTCISKHYALNNQILAAFESNSKNQLWPVAYQFGLKFVETALLEIPKHGYFYASKFSQQRLKATVDARRVCRELKVIVCKQLKELSSDIPKLELLHYLATEQYEHLPLYEDSRRRVALELAKAYPNEVDLIKGRRKHSSSNSFTSTLLACGDSFTAVFCPGVHSSTLSDEYKAGFPDATIDTSEAARRRELFPPTSSEERQPEELTKTASSASTGHTRQSSDFTDNVSATHSFLVDRDRKSPARNQNRKVEALPPDVAMGVALDLPDPALPPDHDQMHSDYDLERALFLSGLQVELPRRVSSTASSPSLYGRSEQEPFAPPGAKKRESASSGLTIEMLAACYHEDFTLLRNSGRVSVSRLPTHQGRIPGSTNGCTVISPLLCIHHFINESKNPDLGLPDQTIIQVIDDETPSILPSVRKNLGLVKDAFLIPVDAHESLMQQNYMCQEQFLNVCGGNILEEEHLQPFLDQMTKIGTKKLAASFFFHEHVMTILQLRRSATSVWFDVIDSLPHEKVLSREGVASMNGSPSDSAGTSQRLSDAGIALGQYELLGFDSENVTDTAFSEEFLMEPVHPPQAARIRCMDVESLKATLLWHACSVFTAENRAYIDTYEWDENLTDFDPRVFQAFIWTEI